MRWLATTGVVWTLLGCSAGELDAPTPTPDEQTARDPEQPAAPGDPNPPADDPPVDDPPNDDPPVDDPPDDDPPDDDPPDDDPPDDDPPDDDPPLEGEGTSCAVDGEAGICVHTSRCVGTATPGHCPGPGQVQCCVEGDAPVDPEPDPMPDAEPPNGIWRPAPGTSWQWQLTGGLDTSFDVEMYDIDLFDVSANMIDQLHADGRVVICYFSAGSHEDWREDADAFPRGAIGDPLDGWAGERWIDVRDAGVRAVMAARLDLAAAKGCDGVEPDNVDGYDNAPGFNFNGGDQIDYNRWLAAEAHARGLSIGLKNDLAQIGALIDHFDWALNEECAAWNECDALTPFIDAGKAVFHVEYSGDTAAICRTSDRLGLDTLIKRLDLDAWRQTCD